VAGRTWKMTPKNLISADLNDLLAIDIHCSQWSGAISIPIPLLQQGLKQKMPTIFACPGCGVQLWDGDPGYNAMVDVLSALSAWRQRKETKFKLGFKLSL
jgi:hypothetical protein